MLDICLQKEIQKHMAPHPGAAEFTVAFGNLCHAVDDLIDQDNPAVKDYKIHLLDTIALAEDIFSSPFYHSNLWWLYPIVKNIHRVYCDAVLWEKSTVEWQARYGDVLRCFGNEIIVAILEHVCHLPYQDLRRISLGLRENSWHEHHDKDGRPV